MNDEAVYRTAPATPGLLISCVLCLMFSIQCQGSSAQPAACSAHRAVCDGVPARRNSFVPIRDSGIRGLQDLDLLLLYTSHYTSKKCTAHKTMNTVYCTHYTAN